MTISTSSVNPMQKCGSRTSPRTTSTSETHGTWSSQPQLLKELYWHSARTCAPAPTRASVKCEPMNPSAPVTRIRFSFSGISVEGVEKAGRRTHEFRESGCARLKQMLAEIFSLAEMERRLHPGRLEALPDGTVSVCH